MELTKQELEALKQQIKKELITEILSGKSQPYSVSQVRKALKKVNNTYSTKVQDLADGYVWDAIQRIACLMNGYSKQRLVQDSDAEKVANTVKELCETIIEAFKQRGIEK